MDSFVINNEKYIIGVDFGKYDDVTVKMVFRRKGKQLEILESEVLNKEDFKKEEERQKYLDYFKYLLDNNLIECKGYNGFFDTSEDEIKREKQIKELKVGDYIECYNGNRGVIKNINFPYFDIHLKDSCIVWQNVHMMDIKRIVVK